MFEYLACSNHHTAPVEELVWLPASTLVDSKLSVTPVSPWDPMPSSGLQVTRHTHDAYNTYMQTNTHIQNKKKSLYKSSDRQTDKVRKGNEEKTGEGVDPNTQG